MLLPSKSRKILKLPLKIQADNLKLGHVPWSVIFKYSEKKSSLKK